MRVFAIKDEELTGILAYLLYYEQAKSFYIELPDDADPWETPLLFLFSEAWQAHGQCLLEPYVGSAAHHSI